MGCDDGLRQGTAGVRGQCGETRVAQPRLDQLTSEEVHVLQGDRACVAGVSRVVAEDVGTFGDGPCPVLPCSQPASPPQDPRRNPAKAICLPGDQASRHPRNAPSSMR